MSANAGGALARITRHLSPVFTLNKGCREAAGDTVCGVDVDEYGPVLGIISRVLTHPDGSLSWGNPISAGLTSREHHCHRAIIVRSQKSGLLRGLRTQLWPPSPPSLPYIFKVYLKSCSGPSFSKGCI